jgi:DHA3 family tetracycline resistance protein-like MFS transporter
MRRLSATSVYLRMEAIDGLLYYMWGVAFSPYLILEAGLNPFRLLVLGTVLEVTVLLCEVPTGVVADTFSRRASIVFSYFIQGTGFLLLGLTTSFPLIALSQVMWGLGYTFKSGADVAWITDEIGERTAAPLYVRAAQGWQGAAVIGIVIGTALLTFDLGLAISISGALQILMGVWLIFAMPETRRRPEREEGASIRGSTATTLKKGWSVVRLHPVLLLIFAVVAFDGLSSEGLDRLFALHFIEDIGFPSLGGLDRAIWWGIIDGGGLILAIGAGEYVRRRIDLTSHREAGRSLAIIYIAIMLGIVGFGLSSAFALALASFWAVALLREVADPILTAWVNQGLDSESRATVNSMSSQVGALGEAVGGISLGAFATARGTPATLVLTGLLRAPALLLFARALRKGSVGTLPPDEIEPVAVEPGKIETPGVDHPE